MSFPSFSAIRTFRYSSANRLGQPSKSIHALLCRKASSFLQTPPLFRAQPSCRRASPSIVPSRRAARHCTSSLSDEHQLRAEYRSHSAVNEPTMPDHPRQKRLRVHTGATTSYTRPADIYFLLFANSPHPRFPFSTHSVSTHSALGKCFQIVIHFSLQSATALQADIIALPIQADNASHQHTLSPPRAAIRREASHADRPRPPSPVDAANSISHAPRA